MLIHTAVKEANFHSRLVLFWGSFDRWNILHSLLQERSDITGVHVVAACKSMSDKYFLFAYYLINLLVHHLAQRRPNDQLGSMVMCALGQCTVKMQFFRYYSYFLWSNSMTTVSTLVFRAMLSDCDATSSMIGVVPWEIAILFHSIISWN